MATMTDIQQKPGSTGISGEQCAASYLERHSCIVVERNTRVEQDEIDLVVRHRGQLVVVEVKTSTNGDDPFEAVDEQKFRRMQRAAAGYRLPIGRIDLVGIEVGGRSVAIRWLQGVV